MTSEAPAARRIPRGQQRREQLVCVAEQVFLEHGFTDSTMQTIASRAGASKETLYRHFACKEALFAEVIGRRAEQISGAESALSSDGPPRRVLFELGCGVLKLMTQGDPVPCSASLSPRPRERQLGAIYAKGPGATLERLTEYLRAATARGELRCTSPGARRRTVPWRRRRQLPHAGPDRIRRTRRSGEAVILDAMPPPWRCFWLIMRAG